MQTAVDIQNVPAMWARVNSPQQAGRRIHVREPQLLHSLTWASKDVVVLHLS